MKRTLIIKERSADITLSVRIVSSNGARTNRIASFSKSGLGYVSLGAAGREITKLTNYIDDVVFTGHHDTYRMLVSLEVIKEEKV